MEALGITIVVISVVLVLASAVVWGHDSRETMIDDRLG
jgi:hypothetical protein